MFKGLTIWNSKKTKLCKKFDSLSYIWSFIRKESQNDYKYLCGCICVFQSLSPLCGGHVAVTQIRFLSTVWTVSNFFAVPSILWNGPFAKAFEPFSKAFGLFAKAFGLFSKAFGLFSKAFGLFSKVFLPLSKGFWPFFKGFVTVLSIAWTGAT